MSINTVTPDIRKNILKRNLKHSSTLKKYIGGDAYDNGLLNYANIDTPINDFIKDSEDLVDTSNKITPSQVILNRYYGGNQVHLSGIVYSSFISSLYKSNNVYNINEINKRVYTINKTQQDSKSYRIANNKNSYLDIVNTIQNQSASQVGDIIGGLTKGFDISTDGVTSGPVGTRTSIIGRGLTSIGSIRDTAIGVIGAEELYNTFANKIANNTYKKTLGQININPTRLLGGEPFVDFTNYEITVPDNLLGRAGDYLATIMGVSAPFSQLTVDEWRWTPMLNSVQGLSKSSSFRLGARNICYNYNNSNNNINSNIYDISRDNKLISKTGKGQVSSLFDNLNYKLYKPAYTDGRFNNGVIKPDIYSYNNEKSFGFIKNNIYSKFLYKNNNYKGRYHSSTWSPNESENPHIKGSESVNYTGDYIPQSNGILGITNSLFTNNLIKSPLNQKATTLCNFDKDIKSTTSVGLGMTSKASKGSAVHTTTAKDGEYCRTWSAVNPYSQLKDAIRHSGINSKFGKRNFTTLELKDLSVLEDTGLVRIGPNKNDTKSNYNYDNEGNILDNSFTSGNDVKRFMFSIENLAWADDLISLPPYEIGPGDKNTIVTNNDKTKPNFKHIRGRIMWFPPYDITFSDNTSINWETHNFIGRGEPVYTYNNTERSGTLSFKIITDHSYVHNEFAEHKNDNGLKDKMEILWTAFNSGCELPPWINDKISEQELEIIKDNIISYDPEPVENHETTQPDVILAFFPNDCCTIPSTYQIAGNTGNTYPNCWDKSCSISKNGIQPDRISSDKNNEDKNMMWLGLVDKISEILQRHPYHTCKIEGHASTAGNVSGNKKLSDARNKYVLEQLSAAAPKYIDRLKIISEKSEGSSKAQSESKAGVDTQIAIAERSVIITIEYDAKYAAQNTKYKKNTKVDISNVLTNVARRFLSESDYFKKVELTTNLTTSDITDQIEYFHPSFHSTTPEGLNKRLTFLEQCTRQGPTLNNEKCEHANNLAFGRPPICILRIGDFYHTKIIITSLNITYDPLVWDLNPEGVGVQPMIANIDIAFNYIGGSSLSGPVNQLQNAVSNNFFANTELFTKKHDYKDKLNIIENIIEYKPLSDKELKEKVVNDMGINDNVTPEEKNPSSYWVSFNSDYTIATINFFQDLPPDNGNYSVTVTRIKPLDTQKMGVINSLVFDGQLNGSKLYHNNELEGYTKTLEIPLIDSTIEYQYNNVAINPKTTLTNITILKGNSKFLYAYESGTYNVTIFDKNGTRLHTEII